MCGIIYVGDNMKNIVDCHIHALTKKDLELYLKSACASKYINVRGLYIDETLNPFEFEEFIDNENMYFTDSVDLEDVDNELIKVKNDLSKYPRILSIKIYLGYQEYYANDERIFKIVEFASQNNLSITFHCGEMYGENGESVYSPYSDAKYIEDVVKEYPNVNFIVSHINWPGFEEVFSLCNKYDNVYTDFSGCNDGETEEDREKQNRLIADNINKYIKKYPKIKKKLMYGTDFFAVSNEYSDVSSYIKILDLLDINEKEKEDILHNNVCNAYKVEF